MSVIIIGEGLWAGRPAGGVVTPPSVSAVSPNTAFKLGSGIQLTIDGGPFFAGAGLSAWVDNVPCTSVTWVSATRITAVTGTITTEGFKDVKVQNPDGGNNTLAGGYLALQAFLWLRANVGEYVLDANNKVATWTDLSGSGNSLVSQGVNTGPLITTNAINGRQAVQFSTGADYLQRASFSGPSASEVFIVKRSVGTGQQGLWDVGSSNTQDWHPFGSNEVYDSWGSTVRKNTGIPAGFNSAATWQVGHLWNASSAAGAYRASMNGSADYFSTGTNVVGWQANFILGKNFIGTVFNGHVGELVGLPSVRNSTERARIASFLKAAWIIP